MNIPQCPVVLGEFFHQVELDFYRVGFFGDAKLVGDALHVGVYDDAWDAVDVASDDVGGLAAYTW